ncbi:MAG: chloride channel protein [Candidatus Omnitrophica bacterium]|nr:chloride channel protein [Candidatus Omnitrophota bacterium]
MTEKEPAKSTTTEGLTISPSLDAVTEAAQVPQQHSVLDSRVVFVCILSMGLGFLTAIVAQVLLGMINLITNLSYYGQFSLSHRSPADAIPDLGLWSIPIPVFGALIIGIMARYGSKAIRGHGTPEAMEQVLTNESRIPARVTFLKPLSSAISIGTGGPFGAEGPIIATGGAVGSVLGQFIRMNTLERKTLLAAGAAAGMAATFGSPVSAVLLAIELLLFEFRPRSIIPVALAATTASGVRMAFEGMEPVFAMPDLDRISMAAFLGYVFLGGIMGVVSVLVTKVVYGIEDGFEKLPVHWMWWPSIGAVVVGVIGYFAPDTLGVGYYNISAILSNDLTISALLFLCGLKFVSWSVALGSGTSGGTLAPLFTIGGGVGCLLGIGMAEVAPWMEIDPRIAALVGMAAIFSGASRAMLASAVFAFETTLQPIGLLPLLGGCAASYLIAGQLMRNSIMTEKIARRGIKVPEEFLADILDQVSVMEIASKDVIVVRAEETVEEVREWLSKNTKPTSHHGFPVLDKSGVLIGVVTRRDLSTSEIPDNRKLTDIVNRPVRFVYDHCSVRQATDHMLNHDIGRLPVMTSEPPHQLVGIVTRSDILSAYQKRMRESVPQEPVISIRQ